jgi:hypothetical protein
MFAAFVGLLTEELKPYLSFNTRLDNCLCVNAFLVINQIKQMYDLGFKVRVLKMICIG